MSNETFLVKTPWDARAFGMDTYELREISEETLEKVRTMRGHFTVKTDPLASKQLLHAYGFYYCDTLLEPHCSVERFVSYEHGSVTLSTDVGLDELLAICHGAFEHGRYHRDFHITKEMADVRYDNWLKDLYAAGNCFALLYDGEVAGFFGVNGSKIVLHALAGRFKGKGLAKYFWSSACRKLFSQGHQELTSSVSASNVSVLNLYASLGFRFRNPCDVYHLAHF